MTASMSNGMAMLEHALTRLDEMSELLAELLQVTSTPRDAILDGANGFTVVVNTNGLAGRTSFSGDGKVLQPNSKRRGAWFFNASPTAGPSITLGLGNDGSSGGIVLVAQGFPWNGLLGQFVYKGAVSPIASGNGALLVVVEA